MAGIGFRLKRLIVEDSSSGWLRAHLYGAVLSNDNGNGTFSATASVTQAHLKNVNLATAQLSGVDFTLANFYGKEHSNPNGCATTIPNSMKLARSAITRSPVRSSMPRTS